MLRTAATFALLAAMGGIALAGDATTQGQATAAPTVMTDDATAPSSGPMRRFVNVANVETGTIAPFWLSSGPQQRFVNAPDLDGASGFSSGPPRRYVNGD